jgi:ribosomal protein L11 methyltransferase
MKLARGIRSVVAPGGLIVLSGLRESEGAKVSWAYRQQGFRLVRKRQRDIWLTLVFADPRRARAGASIAAATLLGPQPD